MALWEQDDITVKDLGKRLYLDSGTLTPMLKKLEALDYVKRIRSSSDERNVYIQLTLKGQDLKKKALSIPKNMICTLDLEASLAGELLTALHKMMQRLDESEDALPEERSTD
jgi:DNA-binding MarR family transcriptional regulator